MTELEEAKQRAERANIVCEDWIRRCHARQVEVDRLRQPFEVAIAGSLWLITPPDADGRPRVEMLKAVYP